MLFTQAMEKYAIVANATYGYRSDYPEQHKTDVVLQQIIWDRGQKPLQVPVVLFERRGLWFRWDSVHLNHMAQPNICVFNSLSWCEYAIMLHDTHGGDALCHNSDVRYLSVKDVRPLKLS